MTNRNIVIIGVGGQGTLLTSRVLGQWALSQGLDVKVSEVHGMAQRGGSVITYVRVGNAICVPMVEAGTADFILAFEPLEGARALSYLKTGGTMIVNTRRMLPMPVAVGSQVYPEDVLERLHRAGSVIAFDAQTMAENAGETRAVNMVLLGALCRQMAGDKAAWEQAVADCVAPKFLPGNQQAFEAGYNLIQ